MTYKKHVSVESLIEAFMRETGQIAFLYPRRGVVSINGFMSMKIPEAMEYMREAITSKQNA